MNLITDDHVHIENPAEPVHYYDLQIPKGRILEAWLDGVSDDRLCQMAKEAAVYRTEKRTQLVCSHRKEDVQTLLRETLDAQGIACYIGTTEELTAVRPLFPSHLGMLARFISMDPDAALMTEFLSVAHDLGLEPAGWKGRRGDLVPQGLAHKFLALSMSVPYQHDAHQLVRAKVITGRPGGLTLELTLPEETFSEKENDGTLFISEEVDRPWQGTLHTIDGCYAKGVGRPPLKIGNFEEAEAACSDMAFGRKLNRRSADFHILSHLPASRASFNLQAILFSARHPEKVIQADTERLNDLDPKALLSREQRRKVDAGVPIALLMDEFAPWKWASQMHCDGVRATVFGSHLVPIGRVSFLPQTWKKIKQIGFEEDDSICLLRDPALPNGSAMNDFTVFEPARWASGFYGPGIVLNPLDPVWKAMGGDFDGDQAVAFKRTFELTDKVPVQVDLKKHEKQDLIGESITSTVVAVLTNGLAPSLGPTITAAQRMAELGLMDESARWFLSDLAQACVSAQKHAMKTDEGRAMYMLLRQFMEQATPEHGFVTDMIRAVRSAPGLAAKQLEWGKLISQQLPTLDEPVSSPYATDWKPSSLPVLKALRDRLLALDKVYQSMAWLNRDNTVLPKHIKDTATHHLMEEVGKDGAARQMRWLQAWTREWNQLRRKLAGLNPQMEEAEVDADVVAQVHQLMDDMAQKRFDLRLRMKEEKIHPLGVIAYTTNYIAATLVKAEVYESLDLEVREVFTGLSKAALGFELPVGGDKPHTCKAADLWPALFTRNQAQDMHLLGAAPDHEVRVRVLKDNAKSYQVKVML